MTWFRGRKTEREFDQELSSHVEMHTADGVRAGMTQEEARRRALIALGGIEQTKERYREVGSVRWVTGWVRISDTL